jgi:hypothetical protein
MSIAIASGAAGTRRFLLHALAIMAAREALQGSSLVIVKPSAPEYDCPDMAAEAAVMRQHVKHERRGVCPKDLAWSPGQHAPMKRGRK